MRERIEQPVPAHTRSWQIAIAELNVSSNLVSIRFDDGTRQMLKQVTGDTARDVLNKINTRSWPKGMTLQQWILTSAMTLWPEDFDGTVHTSDQEDE